MTAAIERVPNPERLAAMAATFRAFAEGYPIWGSPFYGALAAKSAEEPSVIALASQGQERGEAFHLFAAVQYLLLRDPSDPLARYFPTFAEHPAPLEEGFHHFVRFCSERREEILHLFATRTVQQTYVERCNKIMPAFSYVADLVGEPLNLIEIGCSAGVLLTFDKYAYDLKDRGLVGPTNAPLTLSFDVCGGPPLRIPKIGSRIGLDLHPIDVRSEEERLWTLAQTFPETREERRRLAISLDVVRATDIRMFRGDALDLLPDALAQIQGPVCVFHSACLMYWSPSGKEALNRLLSDASRHRDIYRVGAEPPENFHAQPAAGAASNANGASKPTAEITIARYHRGSFESRVAAHSDAQSTFFHWLT